MPEAYTGCEMEENVSDVKMMTDLCPSAALAAFAGSPRVWRTTLKPPRLRGRVPIERGNEKDDSAVGPGEDATGDVAMGRGSARANSRENPTIRSNRLGPCTPHWTRPRKSVRAVAPRDCEALHLCGPPAW